MTGPDVLFDPSAGRLRLPADDFEQLVSLAAGTGAGDAAGERLAAAGVLTGGTVHPAVRPALSAAVAPVCQGTFGDVSDTGESLTGRFFVSPDAGAYVLDVRDGRVEVLTAEPSMLAASLARVWGLGPRPAPPRPAVALPVDHVTTVLGADEGERRRVLDAVEVADDGRRVLEQVAAGPWHLWTLTLRWPPRIGQEGQRDLAVLDLPDGLALLHPADGLLHLRPTRAREVWRMLAAIMPADDDLPLPV